MHGSLLLTGDSQAWERKLGAEGEIRSRIDLINRKYEQECIRQQDHADPKARSGAWDVVDATEV